MDINHLNFQYIYIIYNKYIYIYIYIFIIMLIYIPMIFRYDIPIQYDISVFQEMYIPYKHDTRPSGEWLP